MTILGRNWKLALSGLVFLVLASSALSQFPQPGGKGSKGSFSQDPEEKFKAYANGKDYIDLNDPMLHPFAKMGMDGYAKQNNITDGKITRDQFLKYSEERKKMFMTGGFPGKGGMPPPGGPMVIKVGDTPPAKPGDPPGKPGDPSAGKGPEKKDETPEEFEAKVKLKTEEYFKSRDHNQDGFLNVDEMSRTLRENYKKFDKNGDNLISFDECKDYMRAYMKGEIGGRSNNNSKDGQQGGDNKSGSPPASGSTEITINLTELDERPEVYTGTKLPAGLPPWFSEIDTDKDGQIGLYEWIAAKKSMEEFKAIDRNGDSFLTPDEVLYHVQMTAPETATVSASPQVSPGAGPKVEGDQGKGKSGFPSKKDKGGFKMPKK